MTVNETECFAAGVDPKKIKQLAIRLDRCGRDAQKLGVTIFGGSGTGTLRKRDDLDKPCLVLASLDSLATWDGGDGAEREDESGLLRGE